MRRRLVLAQLTVFGTISVLILAYTAFGLLGVKLRHRPFPVTVQLRTGGGIFDGAEVAYRGVGVGRVTSAEPGRDGVTLTLSIDSGTRIPRNAVAHVYALSAVGEQYLDLVPTGPSDDHLRAGDVIPASRTTTPLKTATVLYDLERFVDSLDARDLQILGREGAAAFADTGPQLRSILVNASTVLDQLARSQGATDALLRDGATLLRGAAEHAGDFDTFARSLRQLSATLAASTPTISRIVDEAVPTTLLVDRLVRANGGAIGVLLGNLATLSDIQTARVPGLKALLVAVPRFGELAPSIVRGGVTQGVINLNATGQLCPTGVPMTSPVSGTRSPLRAVSCTSPAVPRGAAYAPRPGGGTQAQSGGATVIGPSARTAAGGAQVGSYDPGTGLVTTADGGLVRLGTNGGQQELLGARSWQSLLLAVAGR